ncbi:hypothetical protein C8R43DRAFT_1123577 [Mycena crocata]|nr:hypothetical protein C8R43DRAFT_1123577 [Mycena crocata]
MSAHKSPVPVPGSPVPYQFIITLHASADFDAHISALQEVIATANEAAEGKGGDDEAAVVSKITMNAHEVTGLPLYGGIFGEAVLSWIKKQEAVKTVTENVYSELD